MIAIVCVDDNKGMMFNHRCQSQDRVLREDILQEASGKAVWMNAYSAKQFADTDPDRLKICEKFLEKADCGEFCFVEDKDLRPYLGQVEEIVLYKWNRVYPADFRFEVDLSSWKLEETKEFSGSSHEKITKERYTR